MNVTLREITADTVIPVVKLSVKEEQQKFVATNAVSLAQALFSEEAWYRAIYKDDCLAGFVMLYDESLRKSPPESPKLILWRLMIDHQYQGMGIGRAVIDLILEHARQRECFKNLQTSYVPGERGPEKFYLSLGFTPTGEMDDGEIVITRSLTEKVKSQI